MGGPADLQNRLRSVDPGESDSFHSMEYGRSGGYEWIEVLELFPKCQVVPGWGRDGWTAGSWPLVVFGHFYHEGTYGLITYVEGDVTVEGFASKEDLHAATDEAVEWHWRHGQGGPDVDHYPEGDLPPEYRGPYTRGRAKPTKEA